MEFKLGTSGSVWRVAGTSRWRFERRAAEREAIGTLDDVEGARGLPQCCTIHG